MSTRERILDAAAEVLRAQGVAQTTTKQIARVAGCSEALLYKHFHDKEEILLHVLRERMPAFPTTAVPGEGTVTENLTATAHQALRFYRDAFPMFASLLAQPTLMTAARESLAKYGAGPQLPIAQLADYLRAEQRLGRVRAAADAEAAAALLLGACFQQGFLRYFHQDGDFPAGAAADLVAGLLPLLNS
ncbi:AcrR family transcriptional regulator [Kitasatospora sp. GP30]|uniref:TetR/AcrR family transcriptional regulator n=1 Tax=Kitasatospora sp. GP30 TaxID=3035084 RepID=UPI000C70BED6|nr:TetR/AcrR family transcriptional regulator [Kitasatospora sp. GP30]MDH6143213.1 AcrR family transcriptional regulator [Kitasatospora sp. GP30]